VQLLEERFHEVADRRREDGLLAYGRPLLVHDAYALPVAQRQHALAAGRHQWRAASVYLYEPGTFVLLAGHLLWKRRD
jgi:hypothetical protein